MIAKLSLSAYVEAVTRYPKLQYYSDIITISGPLRVLNITRETRVPREMLLERIYKRGISFSTHLCLSCFKRTLANSVDPDQNAEPDQDLHCLHYVQEFL